MPYQAEYIWLDGAKPTAQLRSKTRIVANDVAQTPDALALWGFDGSSTGQATGDHSDLVLRPVFTCPDPLRGRDNVLVLCDVRLPEHYEPHATNTRAQLVEVYERHLDQQIIFGIEQEYTLMRPNGHPYGFPADGSEPTRKQGPYYCGVGAENAFGRPIIEEHTQACLDAGLMIEGTNAEVMPGQWEFQIGAADPVTVCDHLWVGRWLLKMIGERHNVVVSFDAKPVAGRNWNGAGAHTNFSTAAMRADYGAIIAACEAIGTRVPEHLAGYGDGIEARLTGGNETAPYDRFSYGVSNRGASIRIPWQVELAGRGYAEDRRPNANADPSVVTRLITETICSAATP
jgi:glutamine synthetase